jgi:hypothetical protein
MPDVLRQGGEILAVVAGVILWIWIPVRISRDDRIHPASRSWIAGVAVIAPVISFYYVLWLLLSAGGTRPTLFDFPRNPVAATTSGVASASAKPSPDSNRAPQG